jgi:membrane peptidoglycan carboxypeptidase
VHDREALEKRMNAYLLLLAQRGVFEPELAEAARSVSLGFLPRSPLQPARDFVERKAATALRNYLSETLGVSSLYELDQLHLEVDTTIDSALQTNTIGLFRELADRKFVKQNGLDGEHLLEGADPSKVLYSLLLFERTPVGNVLRVQADNLDQPLDINRGAKMELGSTAKLRTLAHYFEIVSELHDELSSLDKSALAERKRTATDPITRWAVETVQAQPGIALQPFLDKSLERRYSASPGEAFFTGGGLHAFANYDKLDNGRIMPVREAFQRSTNLVFIRLMRDLVRYHQARLPYDIDAVLHDPDNSERRAMLDEIADDESRRALSRAYRRYRGLPSTETVTRLLGRHATSPRHLTIVFYAFHHDGTPDELAQWLQTYGAAVTAADLGRLVRAYGNPRLNISDYGYLLSRHPLEVWTVRELVRYPDLGWEEILERSREARVTAGSWLFKTRNRAAQDRRLRIRVERDAFARMTPDWRRLGFPFDHLVPSYATSIGSSGDRPAALAALVGTIVNDGMWRRNVSFQRLRFGHWTPWETVFEPGDDAGERVMRPEVARVLRTALASVVEGGTGRRLAGAFLRADGTRAVVGGKTGTGDNRFQTFHRGGGVRSSRAVNRTATFTFFVDDRYFGVLTAAVLGKDASRYSYTSSLPLSVLKLLAPEINARLDSPAGLRMVSAADRTDGS